MVLHPTQKKVAQSPKRFRIVNCGRGWGKTTLALEELLGVAIAKKDRIVVYIAPTYQQVKDIAFDKLVKRAEPIITTKNETTLEVKVRTRDNGQSIIRLRSWESIEKLRGQEFDFIVVDEVSSMRYFNEGWEAVLRPTLRMSKGGTLFISTPKGFNHFYDLYNKDHDDYEAFTFTSYDSPYLSKEEIDSAKTELTEDRFAQEYMADWRRQVGLVYGEFDRQKHVYDEADIQEVERIAGIDFGFTNPAAVTHIIKDRDNHYWVTDELYRTEMTEEQIAEYVASCGFNKVYPDPENPSAIKVLKDKKVNVYEVTKGAGSISSGINKVRELFKQGRIHIHKSCKNLLWELETYSYPEKRDNHNESEVPIKENDHLVDSLRYALVTNGSTPVIDRKAFEVEEEPLYSDIGL